MSQTTVEMSALGKYIDIILTFVTCHDKSYELVMISVPEGEKKKKEAQNKAFP